MFERFTQQARQCVVTAQEEARTLEATQILPVHLLFGAIAQAETSSSALAMLLQDSGLTAVQLHADIQGMTRGTKLDEQDAAALESIGIDLDAVRSAVEGQFGQGALDNTALPRRRRPFSRRHGGAVPFSQAAKSVLEYSLREATALRNGFIGTEHILLGALRCADPQVLSLIRRYTDPDTLAARIRRTMDSAA